MKKLFVAFSWSKGSESGFDNTCLDYDKVVNEYNIFEIQAMLEIKHKYDKVIVDNFRRME